MKDFFLNNLVYTSSNLKKFLILLVVNVIGISTVLGIPVVVIFDLAFIYYNLNKLLKNLGGIRFLFKLSNFLWLFILIALIFFLVKDFFS